MKSNAPGEKQVSIRVPPVSTCNMNLSETRNNRLLKVDNILWVHMSALSCGFIQFQVKNLRSSVARKAVECLGYLFSTMKRAMEPVRSPCLDY